MEKIKLSQEQIEMVLDNKYNSVFWTYQLGLNIEDEKTIDNYLSSNFFKKGSDYWQDMKVKLRTILCNEENGIPKEEILEVLNDQKTNIVVYLVTLIASQLETIVAVVIPMAALILKSGLHNFCDNESII